MQRMKGQGNAVPNGPKEQNYSSFQNYSSPMTSSMAAAPGTDPYMSSFYMTSTPYQAFGVGDGTWSNSGEHMQTFLGGYGGQVGYDSHNAVDGVFNGGNFGGFNATGFNYGFHGNNDYNAWGGSDVRSGTKHYDDYYQRGVYQDDRVKSIEHGVQGLDLNDPKIGHNQKDNQNGNEKYIGENDGSSDYALGSVAPPKKGLSWASVASQPAKTLPSRRRDKTTVGSIVPGRHMDIGTWDGKNGGPKAVVPPPVPRPAWEASRGGNRSMSSNTYTSPPTPHSPPPADAPQQNPQSQIGQVPVHIQVQQPVHNHVNDIQPHQQNSMPLHQSQMQQPTQSHHQQFSAQQQAQSQQQHQQPPMHSPTTVIQPQQSPIPPQHSPKVEPHQQIPSPRSKHSPVSPGENPLSIPSTSPPEASSVESHSAHVEIPSHMGESSDNSISGSEYNPEEFDLSPQNARFFVIKSYSEDDIHRSIKYAIWCSTEHGNKRLDAAFREREAKGPIYLFYSVNGSGHFCGLAQMISNLDYNASSNVWAQDKWKGQFKVKWIYVKDVPNNQLRNIRLENNENKPVTNSRDTQEVPYDKGIQVLKILHEYRHTTSIFDDFIHYEKRQEETEFRRVNQPSTHYKDIVERNQRDQNRGEGRYDYRDHREYRDHRGDQRGDQRDQRGDPRDQRGSLRDQHGDQRDQHGDQRDQRGDQRDQRGDQREQRVDQRDQRGDQRDPRADQRDQRGDQRDQRGDQRDQRGDQRDQRGDQRDQHGDPRDQHVDPRDQHGDPRDQRGDPRDQRGDPRDNRDMRGDLRDQRGDYRDPRDHHRDYYRGDYHRGSYGGGNRNGGGRGYYNNRGARQ